MLDSLGKIQSPLTRSIAGATAAFSAVIITSAVLIGFTKPKDESVHTVGVYGSLLAAGCGAIFGLVTTSKTNSTRTNQTPNRVSSEEKQVTNTAGWQDWRNFVVIRKVRESEEITSFYLKPQDGGSIPGFKPGQFLTIKLDIPEKDKPVIRTYSLSDYSESGTYYRLSIKREGAPKNSDLPPGLASSFMHDQVQEGTIIPAKPPAGKFFLDLNKSLPAVLISNGVGITPMMSMAKACKNFNSTRHLWFVHGARNGKFHAFENEIKAIAQQYPNLQVHFRYSRPQPEDNGKYQSVGYVNAELLKQSVAPEIEKICGSQDAEYFLCGSPPFLQSLREGLKEWGVPEGKVFFESFGGGAKTNVTTKDTNVQNSGNERSAEIVFAKSGKTLNWQDSDGSILEFAEANGIDADYSCRQGICLTCMCALNEGEVEYEEPPTGTPDEGSVLICVCKPKSSRVVIDL
ncbi:2Fe-2S iron-sulfur cluster-binding protein [Mastigocoleus testarum]|uniref:Oxidoreductase n=1 Tax=Mastigocoleus testarum BC008 TaxID=371196 RepID=A0A0V7ZXB0_9CYAN|nr:2Fe-2S iron-sulfur cluster-binding protein [Mastigocoleus testarum]KST68895.1 oxidoreductase [Mastigocoleus testarum BC008]KST68913.1 oxidoreductase [Mastigocoleus testarum BC008]